ncbi:MAG: hypothetical protein K2X08_07060 [Chlamydiales bacterium]|nr:hypothetical protein [Chlamydiales bacterium]
MINSVLMYAVSCLPPRVRSICISLVGRVSFSKLFALPLEKSKVENLISSKSVSVLVLDEPSSLSFIVDEKRQELLEQIKATYAAKTIQKIFRNYVVRKRENADRLIQQKKTEAAETIQKAFRDYVVRKQESADRIVRQEKQAAVTTIQNAYRTYKVQNSSNERILSFAVFKAATSFLDPSEIKKLPRANSGRTFVAFVPCLPVVLKQAGDKSKQRLEQMAKAKEICNINHFSHLVIPEARISGDFLIESRLPLSEEPEQKTQIGLYLENRACFTQAAIELTSFLCQVSLGDLSGQTNDFWKCLCDTSMPRYDNAMIYLDEQNEGKIGLVDLESLDTPPVILSQRVIAACKQCIRLFPYHFEEILSTALKFDPSIEQHTEVLKKEQGLIIEYFQKVYGIHREFAARNHIDLEVPFQQLPPFTLEERAAAAASMTRILDSCLKDLPAIKSFEDIQLLNLLASTSLEQQKAFHLEPPAPDKEFIVPTEAFQKIFPELCSISFELINEQVQINAKDLKAPVSYPQILGMRSLIFNKKYSLYAKLQEHFFSKFNSICSLNEHQKEYLLNFALEASFTTLQKIGKIAYYNPSFGPYINRHHCIFC